MLDERFLLNKVKVLLGIEDTTLYDERLDLLVGGAVNKLAVEGVENDFTLGEDDNGDLTVVTPLIKDYLICLSYQVALDLNLDIDLQTFYVQYLTRVNQLRCSSKLSQS